MVKAIITDSTAYLPPSIVEQYGVKIVPLNVQIGDKVFKEGVNLSNRYYYSWLRKEPIFPKTSQPSAGDFFEIFTSLPNEAEVLVLLISSELSGTAQSASMARDMLNNEAVKIHIVDSRSTAIGLALQVIKACEMLAQGEKMDDIRRKLQEIQSKNKLFFVVDNLEYLARGGRISHLSKYVGNILQIKPILHLQNGRIEVFKKIRSKQKAVKTILEELKKDLQNVEKIGIAHVDELEEAEKLRCEVSKIYNGDVLIAEAGPVIGTHVGPGTLGLAYY